MLTYINNKIIEGDHATVSVYDLGLTRGYGVFDRLRTYGKRPFHLDDHLKRLQFSASKTHLPLPKPIDEIKQIILHMVQQSKSGESDIRVIVTGGISQDGLSFSGKSNLIISVSPFTPFSQSYYQKGICAVTSPLMRSFPECKTTHYLPAIVALEQAKKSGAEEILFCTKNQEILEGATSNFFAVKKGRLITPPGPHILLGITRAIIIALAKDRFPLEERNLHFNELPDLEEAFVTSSNREVLAVTKIDGCAIGHAIPGPITQFLYQQFQEYTKKESWPLLNMF